MKREVNKKRVIVGSLLVIGGIALIVGGVVAGGFAITTPVGVNSVTAGLAVI